MKKIAYISVLLLAPMLMLSMGTFLNPSVASAQLVSCTYAGGLVSNMPQEQCNLLEGQSSAQITETPSTTTPFPELASQPDEAGCGMFEFGCKLLKAFLPGLATLFLQFFGLLTSLSGFILNATVFYTVVNMSENYKNIPAIDTAWGIIRDVANMGFIFILLAAAIKTILGVGKDTKGLIVKTIVIAILINFSLFFTQLIIDASNILAILFYDAIAPGALTATGESTWNKGISSAFMNHFSFQSLYRLNEGSIITQGGIITVGLMGSIMLLIASFIFFAVSIMFVIRYAVLILLLILSPIAFAAYALPGLDSHAKKWKDALFGQAMFAPVYFLLTWITLYILGGVMGGFEEGITGGGTAGDVVRGIRTDSDGNVIPSMGMLVMFINFIVVIVFLITSLIVAKQFSDKAGSGVTGLNKWAMGAAGGASLGMAGYGARKSLGAMGSAVGDSERLKRMEEKGGAAGAVARLGLAAGRKTSKASFDMRGTALGGTLNAGKAQKGGFEQMVKDKAKKEKEYGESLAPTDIVIDEKQQAHDQSLQAVKDARKNERRGTGTAAQTQAAQDEYMAKRKDLDNLKGVSEEEAKKRIISRLKQRGYTPDQVKDYFENGPGQKVIEKTKKKSVGQVRKEAYANTLRDPRWIKSKLNPVLTISKANKQAAAELRKGKKSAKELFEEAIVAAGGAPPTPPGAPPAPGAGPVAGGGAPPGGPPAGP